MFEQAKWIWSGEAEGTDSYAEFRISCQFDRADSVILRISVDSNYALYLNGKFVDSGQYADFPHYKVYDEIDLGGAIVSGVNHLAFVVWYYGVPSSTYFVGKPGLLFEVVRNGEVVSWSDVHVRSRKSRRYLGGKNERITSQLGLNYHVDLRQPEDWMTAELPGDLMGSAHVKEAGPDMREGEAAPDSLGFRQSVLVEDMPKELYPREIKKLVIKPRARMAIVGQGTFTYPAGDQNFGWKMQHAALTFYRLSEMEGGQAGPELLETDGGTGMELLETDGGQAGTEQETDGGQAGTEQETDGPGTELYLPEGEKTEGLYFIVDLQSENSGYLDFDLEVPKDCRMEVGWGEHLKDGRCRTQIGGRNFSVTVELGKGRNRYMNPFRRLGLRYLQFFVHAKQVKIHYAGIRPVVYPLRIQEYKGSNLLRKRIYEVSQNTLIQCMHEHYEDCPWREQAFYTLDSRNQMLCGYYAFSEYEFPRAGLRLIAKSVREDGTLPICYPMDPGLSIPAFCLVYIIQLTEYYRYAREKETVNVCFPCAKKIMDAFIGRIDHTGLLPNFDEEKNFWNFYEWQPGLDGNTYRGKAYDMCLNALLSWVIEFFLELGEGMGIDAGHYMLVKQELNRKIAEKFYDREAGLFRNSDRPEAAGFSVLANAWGYLCGAAEGLEETKILEVLSKNGSGDPKLPVTPATLSMYTFRYEALLKKDKEFYKDVILEEIDATYFAMLQKGATSFWETLKGEADFDYAGSLCHGWSAMPVYYYELLEE